VSSNFLSVIRMLYNLMVQLSKDLVIRKFSSPIVHFSDGLLVRKLHDLQLFQICLLWVKAYIGDKNNILERISNLDTKQL
jgi:hypothetical protein